MSEIYVTLYTTEPIPKACRNFVPGGDPFETPSAARHLQSLNVIHARSSNHETGLVLDSKDGQKTSDRRGFKGYRHRLIVDEDWQVREYPLPNTPPPDLEKYIEKWGDRKAWMSMNEEVHIIRVEPDVVKVA